MENLKELNKICQKKDYKIKGNWMAKNVARPAAIYLTWLFLHTPITANQVTFLSLLAGAYGCALIAQGSVAKFFFGAIMLQLWYLLDHVDGQVARYRKQASVTGVFFDYYTHHMIHSLIFISIGLAASRILFEPLYMIMGIVSGFNIIFFNLIYDIQAKALLACLDSGICVVNPIENQTSPNSNTSGISRTLKVLFKHIHKSIEVHIVMNSIFIASLVCMVFKNIDIVIFLCMYYFIATFIAAIFKVTFWVYYKKPDKEFHQFIEKINKTNDES